MKEKIYTIPVNEVYETDCECPLCQLKKRFDDESIKYAMGPSLMEPDSRIQSNRLGFCSHHYELMFNCKEKNTLGLGLMLDTHIGEVNNRLEKLYGKTKNADKIASLLDELEKSCVICNKMNYTMERYVDVIFYLYEQSEEFRERFRAGKGYCLIHFKELIISSKKYLSGKHREFFLTDIMELQEKNMSRIKEDINWFTKKFDYRYQDEDWKTSKDAIPRSMEKLSGILKLDK